MFNRFLISAAFALRALATEKSGLSTDYQGLSRPYPRALSVTPTLCLEVALARTRNALACRSLTPGTLSDNFRLSGAASAWLTGPSENVAAGLHQTANNLLPVIFGPPAEHPFEKLTLHRFI